MAVKRWPSAIDATFTSHSTPKRSMSWSRITASQTRSERATRPGDTDRPRSQVSEKTDLRFDFRISIFDAFHAAAFQNLFLPRTHELDHHHPLQGESPA